MTGSPSSFAARRSGSVAAAETWTTWVRQPVRRVSASRRRHRPGLGLRRAGRGEVGEPPAVRLADQRAVLGVGDQQAAEPGDLAHRGLELVGRQRRELVHPRGQQEALEAHHARVVQLPQLAGVAGHRATPERDVDGQLPARDASLGPQRRRVHGRRDRVQRHVDDGGDAAGGGRAGGGGEALPLGAAGLVDVHVTVDETGQQHAVVRELDERAARRAVRRDLLDVRPAQDDSRPLARRPG